MPTLTAADPVWSFILNSEIDALRAWLMARDVRSTDKADTDFHPNALPEGSFPRDRNFVLRGDKPVHYALRLLNVAATSVFVNAEIALGFIKQYIQAVTTAAPSATSISLGKTFRVDAETRHFAAQIAAILPGARLYQLPGASATAEGITTPPPPTESRATSREAERRRGTDDQLALLATIARVTPQPAAVADTGLWYDETLITIPVPRNLRCPITGEIMINPVSTEDGHTFEHWAIAKWFAKPCSEIKNPLTNSLLASTRLTPALTIKSLIRDFFGDPKPRPSETATSATVPLVPSLPSPNHPGSASTAGIFGTAATAATPRVAEQRAVSESDREDDDATTDPTAHPG
jgi:hypothetical protein